MQKLLILGDSYAHDYTNEGRNKNPWDYYGWYDLLKTKFDVVNRGWHGTGPDYSLNELRKINKHFDAVIFIYSHPLRLDFPFLKDPAHASTIKWIIDNQGRFIESKWKLKKWTSENEENEKRYLLDHYNEIISLSKIKRNFLQKVKDELKRYNKSLIIPVFEKFKILKGDFVDTSDSCKLAEGFCLNEVSQNEMKGDNIVTFDFLMRKNHLCEENHFILFEYIIKMLNDIKVIVPAFVENVFDESEILTSTISETPAEFRNSVEEFIYE